MIVLLCGLLESSKELCYFSWDRNDHMERLILHGFERILVTLACCKLSFMSRLILYYIIKLMKHIYFINFSLKNEKKYVSNIYHRWCICEINKDLFMWKISVFDQFDTYFQRVFYMSAWKYDRQIGRKQSVLIKSESEAFIGTSRSY